MEKIFILASVCASMGGTFLLCSHGFFHRYGYSLTFTPGRHHTMRIVASFTAEAGGKERERKQNTTFHVSRPYDVSNTVSSCGGKIPKFSSTHPHSQTTQRLRTNRENDFQLRQRKILVERRKASGLCKSINGTRTTGRLSLFFQSPLSFLFDGFLRV